MTNTWQDIGYLDKNLARHQILGRIPDILPHIWPDNTLDNWLHTDFDVRLDIKFNIGPDTKSNVWPDSILNVWPVTKFSVRLDT